MASGKCAVCNSDSSIKCEKCCTTYYCNEDHRKKHWNEHKITCKPYKIDISDEMGRYMVSTRDIKPGEVILKESPLIVGPRVDSRLLCLGCFRILSLANSSVCSRCQVAPVCGAECESKQPHAEFECNFYAKWFKGQVKDEPIAYNFQIVMPLKCLMLKLQPDSESWESFIQLQSHIEDRESDPVRMFYKEKILDKLQFMEITSSGESTLVEKICAILDINSFEIRGPVSYSGIEQGERLRAIYPKAALMSHNCIGNTHLSVDDNYIMTIHANVFIKAGESIFFNYASPLETTSERLMRLRTGKYFTCTCKRCKDPTELGTYMGSIICSRCHDGYVIPVNPFVHSKEWICEKCKHTYHERLIKTTLLEGWSLIEDTDTTDHRLLEGLLKKLSSTFPPGSVIMTEVKQRLIACLRDIIIREPNPSRSILKRKINLCKELLELLDVIEPGISRLRGIITYELHKPKMILASKEHESGEIKTCDFLEELKNCETILKEAISMLIYESHNSPEGRLLQVALSEMKTLREDIHNITIAIKEKNESKSVKNRKIHKHNHKRKK